MSRPQSRRGLVQPLLIVGPGLKSTAAMAPTSISQELFVYIVHQRATAPAKPQSVVAIAEHWRHVRRSRLHQNGSIPRDGPASLMLCCPLGFGSTLVAFLPAGATKRPQTTGESKDRRLNPGQVFGLCCPSKLVATSWSNTGQALPNLTFSQS